MRKPVLRVIVIGVLLWGGTPFAHGQKATEVYIPLGQSPGLSGRVTVIGTIGTVNGRARTIVGASGRWSAQITDRTRIWLDRSKLGLSNQRGRFADLRRGMLVEVKYEASEERGRGPAEWIKVQLTESSPGSR